MSRASRARMTPSASHGRRSWTRTRMITAASIIRRSASGSATLPNADSTRQRRASQPSTWSLTPAVAQTPERVRADSERVYREMRAAGYTAVGEFHYLGSDEAFAAAEAADAAGITFVLLYAAYARGGLERFRQESPAQYLSDVEALRDRGIAVGLAPRSVRACPPDWLEGIGRYAEENEPCLHVHADEQQREIEHGVADHGVR